MKSIIHCQDIPRLRLPHEHVLMRLPELDGAGPAMNCPDQSNTLSSLTFSFILLSLLISIRRLSYLSFASSLIKLLRSLLSIPTFVHQQISTFV
ncbi:hypothetical protein BDW69DRAFT_64405 [Aspergillus filifer]